VAGGRLIGEAYIAILADTDLFRASAVSGVDKALAGVKGSVKVTGDLSDINKKVATLAAALKGLHGTATVNTREAISDIAGLEAAIVGLWDRLENIPVDFDDSKGLAKFYGLMAGADALAKQLEDLGDADFNINKALAKYYSLEAGAKALQEQIANLDANVNNSAASAEILKLGEYVGALAAELENMRANVTDTAVLAKIVAMQAAALKLARTLENMPVTANTLPFQADMFKLAAQVEALKSSLADVKVTTQFTLPKAPGAYSTMNMGSLNPGEAQMMDALTVQTLAAMTAFTGLNKQMENTSVIGPLVTAALAKIGATQSMLTAGAGGGAWWNALTTHVRLFGGALDGVLPKLLTSVSVWHIAADVILEFVAAWGPAIIAVAAFAAVAAPIADKIYGQWKNITTVIDGVGGKLPDLGTGFDVLQRAVEPSIMTAFGEAMMIVNRNAAPLGAALAKVGNVIDVWGAQLVGWADSASKAFTNIVSVGAKDFAQIGYGFEQVFRIIGNLVKDLPGYVHILLTIGDALLTVAADAVAFLTPVLKAGLALHGFMIYVGLAVTGIVALGRAMAAGALASFAEKTGIALAGAGAAAEGAGGKFNKFGTAIGSFAGLLAAGAVNTYKYAAGVVAIGNKSGIAKAGAKLLGDALSVIPFGAAGLAAAGVAIAIGTVLYFALKNTTTAADKFGASMQALITTSNASNIGKNLTLALTQTEDKYAAVTKQLNAPLPGGPVAQYNKALTSIPQNVSTVQQQAVKSILNNQQALTNAQEKSNQQLIKTNPYASGGLGVQQQKYAAQIQTITGQVNTYGSRLSQLVGVFGSVGAAQSALTLAGVSEGQVATENNKTWATQLIELEGLAKGYGYMGNQAGAAGAQLNALNISTGDVTKNIQTLVSAEQAWITMITGGESAFTTYEQGFVNLNGAVGKSASSAPTVTVRLGNLRQTFTALGATMAGTSAASLAVRQAFDSQLSAGVTLFGNLQMLAGASGNTAAAQGELAKSGKDIIAQLLPFAAGSKQATAEVSSLAQLMGGPATDSFQTLAKWVGTTKGSEADLNTQQAKLTISSANLTTAAKNLGNALDTSLNSAEVAAAAKAGTLDNAINGLATTAAKSKDQVNQASLSLSGEYVAALVKTGVSTTQAMQDLNAYLKMLGYSPAAIAAIDSQLRDSAGQWAKYNTAVMQNNATAKQFQADTAHNKDALAALNGLIPLTAAQYNILWAGIVKQDSAMVQSGKDASGAKQEFINFAENGLKLTANQAQTLWTKFGQQNLDTLGSKAGSTKQNFIQLAENGLHLTTTQAQTLWSEFALQNLDSMASKGNSMKGQFILLAKNGLDLTNTAAQNLWTTLTHQYLDTLATKAGETRDAFIKTAGQFGITRQAAIDLWNSLKQIPANVNTNINENLTGSGEIKALITAQSLTLTTSGAAAQKANLVGVGKAAGGKIGGWDNRDKQLAVLQGGETVVPKNLSTHPAFTSFAKVHGIPGFAGGGVVGSPGAMLANVPTGVNTAESGMSTMTASAMTAFAKAISGALPSMPAGGKQTSANVTAILTEALKITNTPLSWLPAMETLVMKESGGNASAVNPITVLGQHATGLLQTLPSTFAAYAMPGYTAGPTNALDDAIASIRYIKALYGSPASIPGIGTPGNYVGYGKGGRSGRSFAGGGAINEPVNGTGLWSGTPYSFAENGQPEYVSNASQAAAQGNAGMQGATNIGQQAIISQNNMIINLLRQQPQVLGNALSTAGGNGVRHGYYGTQG
jgi:SLT domain-containing protein